MVQEDDVAGRVSRPLQLRTGGNKVSGSDFFGRKQVVEKFWRLICDEDAHILVVAPRRVGKSSLLQYAADNPQYDWIPVQVDFQSRADAVEGLEAMVVSLAKCTGKSVGLVLQL